MENSKIFSTIKELGHVHSKRDELREYCSLKIEQVVAALPRRIIHSDGGDLLDCILNGLLDNHNRSKIKVIDIVLKTMRRESTSLTHCGDVISRICLELPRLPADHLVRWCNESIQSIVDDSDVNMIWRDVLPECLSALSMFDKVKHCETDMTPAEYKIQGVHTLCQCRWTERQLVQLAAMFKDMQLSKNDHKQVVNKICSYMIDIPPDTLPPLVHQMLKLCKAGDLELVLAHLSHYFGARLYAKLEPPPQDSESTTMDIDDITPYSGAELSRSLSTCLYHVCGEPESARRLLRGWPRSQLLRCPFLVDVALALADKGPDYKTVCLDAIKAAIEQRAADELRCKESAWLRSVIPPLVDVASLLKVLTTESANHRQLTVMGLIGLAFSLLAVSPLKAHAAHCWSLGKLVCARLCKAQPDSARAVLARLLDCIHARSTSTQYADCLYVLCKLSPVSIERCSELSTILESCQPSATDYKSAAAVYDAVHPLLNFSTKTRDTLVMVCRKGLYSRDSAHRCLSAHGFLSVLRHTRLSRAAASQPSDQPSDQHSAHSYFTQLTVDLHATHQGHVVTSRVRNEAVCMEVVSILRRCLGQDAPVKQLLYSTIYECAKDKPVLLEPILELLYEHLVKFLPEGEAGPPLLLDKCVQITPTTAILTEPISYLIYAVGQFLQEEAEEVEDILSSQAETGGAGLRAKLAGLLRALRAQDLLDACDVAEDPGLTDLTPESKAKSLKVQQTLLCYEALIAHQIMQWSSSSEDAANSVYSLFKACNQLLELSKSPSKSKKGKLNETKDTVKSQKSQKSQKDKGKAPAKLSALTKDRAGPFKPLPCLWDLKLCLRVVELLYSSEVPWSSLEQRNQLRARRDFHRWALRGVQAALSAELDRRAVASRVAPIAAVVYTRCICRFQDMCDFDDQTTLGCLEVFKTCLSLLFSPTYSLKMESFLPAITGVTEASVAANVTAILEHIHNGLLQLEQDDAEERDGMTKKLVAALVGVATVLLEAPVPAGADMCGIILKLEDYLRTSKQECLSLISPLLTAAAREQQEAPLLDELLLKLAEALGRIDEEDTSAGACESAFPSIDVRSGHAALATVCAHLGTRAAWAAHALHRARDLAAALPAAPPAHAPALDRELKELYKCTVIQLCQLSTWTARVAKLRCSVGAGSDRVLAACVRLYSLLAAAAKQIDVATAQLVRFERLLKLSGKKLSAVTDNLITYLEASQQQRSASRVLRDTKLIPRLVLEAEQYARRVVLLAARGKLNWQHYMSLGTARDFRIKAPLLEEVLLARNEDARDDDSEVNINDAVTEVLSAAASDAEVDSDEDATHKRRRVS